LLGDGAVRPLLLAHSEVKMLLDELRSLEGAPFVAAMQALQLAVESHLAEEEAHLLPELEAAATPAQLLALGSRIEAAKQRVG
jgi:Hemerythrin HHE cation binding domain